MLCCRSSLGGCSGPVAADEAETVSAVSSDVTITGWEADSSVGPLDTPDTPLVVPPTSAEVVVVVVVVTAMVVVVMVRPSTPSPPSLVMSGGFSKPGGAATMGGTGSLGGSSEAEKQIMALQDQKDNFQNRPWREISINGRENQNVENNMKKINHGSLVTLKD